MDKTEMFSNARKIMKKDALEILLKDSKPSDSPSSFLVILIIFMLEHGFDITIESLEKRLMELLDNALNLYEEYDDESGGEKNYTPFGHFQVEMYLPAGNLWFREDEPNDHRDLAYVSTYFDFECISDIDTEIRVTRNVRPKKVEYWVYFGVHLPDEVSYVEVSYQIEFFFF